MPKKGHTEGQILAALHEGASGTRVAEVCRRMGISQATYFLWKKKYAGLGVSEVRELRQLREENGKLNRLVADLPLDRHILQEIVANGPPLDCKESWRERACENVSGLLVGISLAKMRICACRP